MCVNSGTLKPAERERERRREERERTVSERERETEKKREGGRESGRAEKQRDENLHHEALALDSKLCSQAVGARF